MKKKKNQGDNYIYFLIIIPTFAFYFLGKSRQSKEVDKFEKLKTITKKTKSINARTRSQQL